MSTNRDRGPRRPSEAAPSPTGRDRVPYLDWLRVIALGGVFVYHCLQPFSTDDWHIKNAEVSEAVTIPLAFVGSWGIAFFFLISGAGTSLALRWRSTRRYVAERLTRLGVPLLFAYVVLGPVQAYLEARHFGWYEGSFVSFMPRFFQGVWREMRAIGVGSDPLLIGHMFHLWFVVFLLWYSLLGIPVFRWLRGGRGRAFVDRLSAVAARRRGATLLTAVPIIIAAGATFAAFPDEHDWGEFAYYLGFFLAGFVLMSDARLQAAVRRDLWIGLAVGVAVLLALVVGGIESFLDRWLLTTPYGWAYAAFFGGLAVQAWAWAQTATSIGMRVPAFRHPLPTIVSRSAMPFFVVHQPVIVAVAFAVVGWEASLGMKCLSVFAISLVFSAALAMALAWVPIISVGVGVKRPAAARP